MTNDDGASSSSSKKGDEEETKKNTTTFKPPEGAKIQLEFDNSYANFKVERKADEIGDKNFPGSLHNVAELFGNLQMIRPHLTTLHECVERFKRILKEGPDGKQTNGMGQAIVCFNCGFVALPKGGDVGMECANCGEKEHTNKVVCKQGDGSIVPWIENRVAPMTKEERRKQIEADVAIARKLQSLVMVAVISGRFVLAYIHVVIRIEHFSMSFNHANKIKLSFNRVRIFAFFRYRYYHYYCCSYCYFYYYQV